MKSIYKNVPDISISNAQDLVLKNEKVKFNFQPDKELKRTPPVVPVSQSKNKLGAIFRTELPDTSMLENKLGFLGETGGANTYKSEIPIIDWNENYKIHSRKREQESRHPGTLNAKLSEQLKYKNLIQQEKQFLDNSINRIKYHTQRNQKPKKQAQVSNPNILSLRANKEGQLPRPLAMLKQPKLPGVQPRSPFIQEALAT